MMVKSEPFSADLCCNNTGGHYRGPDGTGNCVQSRKKNQPMLYDGIKKIIPISFQDGGFLKGLLNFPKIQNSLLKFEKKYLLYP
jgi:hypothetical protein